MALIDHPKGSTVRTDEMGSYVAYHRQCNNCDIELTSRNRTIDGSLRCKPCTASRTRAARHDMDNTEGAPTKPRKTTNRTLEGHHTVSPERQEMHRLLNAFLLHCIDKTTKDELLSGLLTYEIRERMRFL